VGIVGGYVGICLGYSLRQVPTVIKRIRRTICKYFDREKESDTIKEDNGVQEINQLI
jgi:hypothetical protein